jgi:hypothetical protein
VTLVGCTSEASTRIVPPPTWSFMSAPRACPIGIGELRGGRLAGHGEILRAMGGHVPDWLPSGFGLAGAWSWQKTAWAIWTDKECRLVTIFYNAAGGDGRRTGRLTTTRPAHAATT